MAERRRVTGMLLFCAGLLVLIPLCLVLWGLILPYYAKLLGGVTAPVMRVILDAPIEDVETEALGLFNTGTRLRYNMGTRHPAMDVGALVFNVPPFVALMVLTPGLRWRRRLKALGLGLGILFLGHVAYMVLAFAYSSRIAHAPEIPTALGELFLTLPFLLWIVLGYWDRLAAFVAPAEAGGPAES